MYMRTLRFIFMFNLFKGFKKKIKMHLFMRKIALILFNNRYLFFTIKLLNLLKMQDSRE